MPGEVSPPALPPPSFRAMRTSGSGFLKPAIPRIDFSARAKVVCLTASAGQDLFHLPQSSLIGFLRSALDQRRPSKVPTFRPRPMFLHSSSAVLDNPDGTIVLSSLRGHNLFRFQRVYKIKAAAA